MTPPILISGSLVYDYIMDFQDSFKNHILPDQLHILNVCFVVDQLQRGWGGTGGNIAYAMKMLGARPVLVSAIGKDGGDYLKHLEDHGIATAHIKRDGERFTASAHITTDIDHNQVTAFFNGPLGSAQEIDLDGIAKEIRLALISPTQKEAMLKHMRECRAKGLETVFDPGQQITAFTDGELREMLTLATFVIGNDYELKLLAEKSGWDRAKILQTSTALIVTLGKEGSQVFGKDGQTVTTKACPPKALQDPTGAGDCFRAGFFVGYQLGYDWQVCAQLGSTLASYVLETYGTQEYAFTPAEFKERYKTCYQQDINL